MGGPPLSSGQGANVRSASVKTKKITGPGISQGTYSNASITVNPDGTIAQIANGAPPSGGTVTSVGLSLPSIFGVTGSPITGAGTISATFVNQNANTFFAGPASGVPGVPLFRALSPADTFAQVTYPTTTAPVNMAVNSYGPCSVSSNTTFSTSGYVKGAIAIIDITAAGNFVLGWAGGIQWGIGGAPLQITSGAVMRVILISTGTTAGGVIGTYSFTAPQGGDLDPASNYLKPKVVGVQGFPYASTAPTTGQVPMWNGSAFVPTTPAGAPIATSSTFGLVKPDNTTITISAGVISAVGGSGAATVFNVITYGAVPNSSGAAAANVTAINAAVAAAIAFGGGTVYFPDGVWYINALIAVSTTVPIAFIGNSKSGSRIQQVTANTGIISVTQGNATSLCQVMNLGFVNGSGSNSTADCLACNNSSGPSVNNPGLTVFNCSFCATGGTTFAHNVGIYNLTNAYISLCDFTGNGSAGSRVGVGVYVGGTSQPQFNVVVTQNIMTGLSSGVYAPTAGGSSNIQTLIVSFNQIVGNDYDIRLGNCTQLVVQGNDLESYYGGIVCGTGGDATAQSQIVGNLFYMNGNGSYCISGEIDYSTIVGNTFEDISGPQNCGGIDLEGGSTTTSVIGNSFQTVHSPGGGKGGAVNFGSGTNGCYTMCNPVANPGTDTFVDQSGANFIGIAKP